MSWRDGYGFHYAQDITNGYKEGDPVYSMSKGNIIRIRKTDGYGGIGYNTLLLEYEYITKNGLISNVYVFYGHLKNISKVPDGSSIKEIVCEIEVEKGEKIAELNDTYPAHLHLTVIPDILPNDYYDGYNNSQVNNNRARPFDCWNNINGIWSKDWVDASGYQNINKKDEVFFDNYKPNLMYYNINKISTANDNLYPKINDKGHIVWYGWTGPPSSFEVYIFDGKEVDQVTDNDYPDNSCFVNSKNQIVWSGANEGSGFYFYDEGNTKKLTVNGGQAVNGSPINNYSQIAHSYYENGVYKIKIYDAVIDAYISIDNKDYNNWKPQINNKGHVVWQGWTNTKNELFLYDNDGVTKLTDNDIEEKYYQINDKDQIVWYCTEGDNNVIYLYDYKINAFPVFISNHNYNCINPEINNKGQVVWIGKEGDYWQICLYDIQSDTINKITNNNYNNNSPKINDNGEITWNGNGNIYLYKDGFIYQLTSEGGCANPTINNFSQITWMKLNGTNNDIYLATLKEKYTAISPIINILLAE